MQFSLEHHRRLNPRSGLTLVELLVVIAIISIVSAATIPLFTPPVDDQKTREAARLFSTMLESARSRAVETGRPAGIWLQPLPAPNSSFVSDLFSCEVPEPYSGDDIGSVVQLSWSGTTSIQLSFTGAAQLSTLCHYGDLIRFNNSGEYYPIWDTATALTPASFGLPINPSNAFLGQTGYQTRPGFMPNQTATPNTPPYGVPYQILRGPVKSAGTPTTLPITAPAALIDLGSSGIGISGTDFSANGANPILVTFEPSGQVSKVQYNNGSQLVSVDPSSTIYFLVRLNRDPPDPAITGSNDGFRDQTATWVSINPTTGLVSVSDNTYSPTGSYNTLAASREGAQKATQKGGL